MSIFKKGKFEAFSDEELMKLVKVGKEKAFEELYHRYSKRMLFYFYRSFYGDNEKAQDFLQSLFLKIIEKPELFNVDKKFSTWIYTMASNLCKNEYRKNAVRKCHKENLLNNIDLQDIQIQFSGNEHDYNLFSSCLNRELELMSEKHNMTFVLSQQEGLSIKEISEIMNCSEGTVKSRLFNATKHLSNRLRIFSSLIEKY